jgi:hypothetical protein
MLLCEAAWIVLFRVIHPASGSWLEFLIPYLRLLGGNSRFIFPLGLTALVIDIRLSRRAVSPSQPMHIWLFGGILVFALLWGIGALLVIIFAILFSWH